MKRFLVLGILVALAVACASPVPGGETVTGSGHLVSRSFDLAGFARIEANHAAQVQVERGERLRVDVEMDDNLEPLLDIAVKGDTLSIKLQDGSYRNITLRVQVTMPELTGVTLNGGSTLQSELAGEDLALNLNGGSLASLAGTAGRVTVEASGGSRALLGDLAAGDVDLNLNGGSRAEINASGAVHGQANGASTVTVAGSPASVDVKTEGASRVITE